MKKYVIADILTLAKAIPALALFIGISKLPIWAAFLLFAFGELLDALDGMAAKKWPHPKYTETQWMRRNIKLVESGLDMLLGIAALCFFCLRINAEIGVALMFVCIVAGTICEFVLYGKVLGSENDCKRRCLFKTDPELASKIVGARLLIYLGVVGAVLVALLWCSEWDFAVKLSITVIMIAISIWLCVKKIQAGRLKDVGKFLKK